jgi:hypothetical protein
MVTVQANRADPLVALAAGELAGVGGTVDGRAEGAAWGGAGAGWGMTASRRIGVRVRSVWRVVGPVMMSLRSCPSPGTAVFRHIVNE